MPTESVNGIREPGNQGASSEFTAEIAVETILENTTKNKNPPPKTGTRRQKQEPAAKNKNPPPKTRTRCEPLENLATIVFARAANLPILAFHQLCDTTE